MVSTLDRASAAMSPQQGRDRAQLALDIAGLLWLAHHAGDALDECPQLCELGARGTDHLHHRRVGELLAAPARQLRHSSRSAILPMVPCPEPSADDSRRAAPR